MVKVFRSTIIEAPVDRVWALLRDFNGHERWHPSVAFSEIEDGRLADQVGCVRRFRWRDGGILRERLLKLSDRERSMVYSIVEAPLPLYGYVASVALKPVTDGERTLWCWSSEFEAPAGQEEELAAFVGDAVYEAGFDAVRSLLTAEAPRRRVRTAAAAAAGDGRARTAARPALAANGALRAGAVRVHRFGGPEEMRWESVAVPPPGRGEVRIRHTAIGVNYLDVYCRTGYLPLIAPPDGLGVEAAGTVLEVGPGVVGIVPGDRVAYACLPPGAYAEYRTMPADLLVVLPEEMSDEMAAAGLLKGMTAEFLLHRVHPVRRGEVVLVHAAAGGVGLLLCQWARALGATVIGTVGSAQKAKVARENGCAYPIVRGERDFVEAVLEITGGRGADVVYDAIGRDSFAGSFAALANRGHLVSYGQASGDIGPVEIAGYAAKSATVSRPNFGHYTGTPAEVRAITDRLFEAIRRGTVQIRLNHRYALREAIRRGTVQIRLNHRYALREAAEAHRALEQRRTTGSIVLVP